VKKNLDTYGPNVLFRPHKTSEFVKFLNNVLMGLNLLLWICGVASIATFFAELLQADADDDISFDNVRPVPLKALFARYMLHLLYFCVSSLRLVDIWNVSHTRGHRCWDFLLLPRVPE
jgi:hypothetical protein